MYTKYIITKHHKSYLTSYMFIRYLKTLHLISENIISYIISTYSNLTSYIFAKYQKSYTGRYYISYAHKNLSQKIYYILYLQHTTKNLHWKNITSNIYIRNLTSYNQKNTTSYIFITYKSYIGKCYVLNPPSKFYTRKILHFISISKNLMHCINTRKSYILHLTLKTWDILHHTR